jgi:hypothetical protein
VAIREARQQAYGASRYLPAVTPLAQAPEDVIQVKLIKDRLAPGLRPASHRLMCSSG